MGGPAQSQRRPLPTAHAEEGISPRRILDAVRYWWKWALPAGLVLGITASAVIYGTFRPKYQASAWLRIEEHAPYLAFEAKGAADNSKGFVPTQIEMLRSPMVLGPVIGDRTIAAIPEIAQADNPTEWLRGQVIVKPVGSSELYTVSFICSQPKAAANVVNAILDSYFLLRNEELDQRVQMVIDILDKERESRAAEVDTLRKSVRDMAKQLTGVDPFQGPPDPSTQTAKPLAELTSRMIANEVDETVLRAKLRAREAASRRQQSQVSAVEVEQFVNSSPRVARAAEALHEQKAQLNTLLEHSTGGKENPAYQSAAKRVAANERSLEAMKKELRDEARLQLAARAVDENEDTLASLKSDLENREITRKLLEERYAFELKSVRSSSGDSVTLKFKQDELERAEEVLELISQRVMMLRTEKGAPPRVRKMESAQVPSAPIQSVPYLNMLLAMVAGLCAPFGLAVLKEQLTMRVTDAGYVERQAHLAVLGEITCLPTRSAASTRVGSREHRALHMFEESIEALRTSLLLGEHAHSLRILTVTSAVNREGKTSVAVQLAVSIARASHQRILVIDGDLRDPSIHTVFGVTREPGLVDVLTGKCALKKAIVPTTSELVDAMPAGVLRGNPHKLVENGRWEAFLKQLPAEYRYVIVDTPPVLAASESLVLARGANAVLICAMRDVTRLPQLKSAAERIWASGAKIAGLVLNGVPTAQYADRYGTYTYILE